MVLIAGTILPRITATYKLLNPKHNILIIMDGKQTEVALVKLAYTHVNPLINTTDGPQDASVHSRDHADKKITGARWNWCQELGVKKSLTIWKGRPIPRLVMLEGEEQIFYWPMNTLIFTGSSLRDELPLAGRLVNNEFVPVVVEPEEPELEETEDLPEADVQPTTTYTGDSFSVDDEGHFIGDDGFKVPRDFNEFFDWNPNYIRNWVKKRLHRNMVDDDVMDWEQELVMHMKYLPEQSKHRLPGANGREDGCHDVVETFNPFQQYGASERRFRNYINMCLNNRFSTIMSKRLKNPICRLGNLSFAAQMDPENYDVVDDEYIHKHSGLLSRATGRMRKKQEDELYLSEFGKFVENHDPSMLKVMQALAECGTFGDASKFLGMTEQEFQRARNRLRQLGQCFKENNPVPRQRKPYKRRERVTVSD